MTAFPPAAPEAFRSGGPGDPALSASGFQAMPRPEPTPALLLGTPAGPPPGAVKSDRRRRALLIGASAVAVAGVAAGAIALGSGGDDKKQPVAVVVTGATSGATGTSGSPGAPNVPGGQDINAASTQSSRSGENVPGGNGSSPSGSSDASKPSTPGSAKSSTPASAPGTTQPQAPIPIMGADLLHWRLNDAAGSTTAADGTGKGRVGTLDGTVTFAPTQHGGSAYFNGAAGQIKAGQIATKGPVIDTTKSFTISMWVDQTAITTPTKYVAAFSQDGPQCFAFTFSYSTDTKAWSFVRSQSDSANPVAVGAGSTTQTPLNTWVKLTGVYDAQAGTLAFYINGAQQGGLVKTGSAPYAASGPFAIGRSWYQKYPSNPFDGYISDVEVWSRALSSDEVKGI
jgi:hypothetical protein